MALPMVSVETPLDLAKVSSSPFPLSTQRLLRSITGSMPISRSLLPQESFIQRVHLFQSFSICFPLVLTVTCKYKQLYYADAIRAKPLSQDQVANSAIPLPVDDVHVNGCRVSQVSQAAHVWAGLLGCWLYVALHLSAGGT